MQVACEWNLSARQESVISTVVFAGSLLGANAFGALADTYGRRPGFFVTAIFTCAFGLASAFAPSFGVIPTAPPCREGSFFFKLHI